MNRFANIDFRTVHQVFMIAGDPAPALNLSIDKVWWEPSVARPAPGNGNFGAGGDMLHTNVVAAEILDGVGISWPTLAGTNYAVQWTTNLATNAVWSNLAVPIVGDGTTHCLFDPASLSCIIWAIRFGPS